MKRLIILCAALLLSTVAFAQSDCNAPNCGSVPLLNFDNENGGVTDLFLHYDSDCELWFRTRFSPVEGDSPAPNFYQVPQGDFHFYLRNFMGSWADYESRGTFILDWATYDCIPSVSIAGLYRSEEGFPCSAVQYNIREPDRFEPGCYTFIIAPDTDSRFNVYNDSDTGIQSLKYDNQFYLVMPGETLEFIDIFHDYFIFICIGEEIPGPSIPGLQYDLPLYIEGLSEVDFGDIHRITHLP